MNFENKNDEDENPLHSSSKIKNLNDFKDLIGITNNESYRSFLNCPCSLFDKYKSLSTVNQDNIYELMKIIEQINIKVFVNILNFIRLNQSLKA